MKTRRIRAVIAVAFLSLSMGALLAFSGGSGAFAIPKEEDNCTLPLQEELAPVTHDAQCATLEVTKVVAGTAATGTQFTVTVECTGPTDLEPEHVQAADELPPGKVPPFTQDLTFGETGGTQSILIEPGGSCTITEATQPPGCTLTNINPDEVELTSADTFPVTVTDDCAVPTTTTAAAAPATSPAAAQVVVVQPRLTG